MATGSPQPVAFLARSPKLTQRANWAEVPVAFWLLIRSAPKIPNLYGTVRLLRCSSGKARTASRMPRARQQVFPRPAPERLPRLNGASPGAIELDKRDDQDDGKRH